MNQETKVNEGRHIPGRDVYAVDMIAVLSGANYGTVMRILAAIETLRQGMGATSRGLTDLEDAPDLPAFSFEHEDKQRIKRTDLAVRALFKDGKNREHFHKLKINPSMGIV